MNYTTTNVQAGKDLLHNLHTVSSQSAKHQEITPTLTTPPVTGSMLPGDQQVGVHVQMGTCSVAAMAVAEQTLNALNYATVLVNTILKINDANQVVTGTALATDLVHQLQHIRTFAVLGADADESDAAKVYAKTAHAYATAAKTVAMTMYRLGVITSKRLLVFNDHIAKINQRLDTWKVALIIVNQSQPVVENQPVSR